MNKLCYRVIFNKARGLLMAVSELANSTTGSARTKVLTQSLINANALFKLGRLSLLTYLALGMVELAGASIIANQTADKSLQPIVINTANGIPQIDIQTPNADGVSRNRYSQFDVSEKGTVLNNSRKETSTAIAGYVSGNPYLARGEASVILNEVNSHKESQLLGVIEVAGKKAHVIIANPSGINCSGCGFINSNRTTLTTGQVLLEQGQLKGYQIERGTIRITGKGLNSSKSEKTELLARAIEVNAGIWANDLNVVSGQNQIDNQVKNITARANNANPVEGIAIDVSALGGMYANHINLVGTEKGLGVNNAGEIGAQIGQLVVSADGKLTNSGRLQAKGDVVVNVSGDLTNQGVIVSQQQLTLNAGKKITNQQIIYSEQAVNIQAQALANSKHIESKKADMRLNIAGTVENDHIIKSGKQLALTAKNEVKNSAYIVAQEDIRLTAEKLNNHGTIGNDSGTLAVTVNQTINSDNLTSGGDIKLQAGDSIVTHKTLVAKENIEIQTGSLSNQGTLGSQSGDSDITLSKQLDNQGLISSGKNLTINSIGNLNISENSHLFAKESMRVTAAAVDNQGTMQTEQGDLLLNAQGAVNSRNLRSGASLKLTAGAELNSEQLLLAQKELNIDAAAITNRGSLGSQSADVNLTSIGAIDSKVISAGKNLNLTSKSDVLNRQTIYAANDLILQANALTNKGELGSGEGDSHLTLNSGLGNQGLISSGRQLTIHAAADFNNNAEKQIAAKQGMSITANKIDNQGSMINQQGVMVIRSQTNLDSHTLSSGGSLNLAVGQKLQNYNLIVANQGIKVIAKSLFNYGKMGSQQGDINLTSDGVVDSYILSSGKNVTISAKDDVINHKLLIAQDDLTIKSQANIINYQQLGSQQANVTLTAAGKIDNTELMSSGKQLSLQAGQQINNQNNFYAGHNIIIEALALNNQKMVAKNGDITINARQGITSQKIQAEGHLNLHSQGDITNHNLMYAKQSMVISGKNLLNQGDLLSGKSLKIDMQQGIDSKRLYAGEDATLNAITSLINRHQLSANRRLSLSGDDLVNHNTIATEQGDLSIHVNEDFIHKADNSILSSGRDLNLSSRKNIENHQTVYAKGKLALDGQTVSNFGDLLAEKGMSISAQGGVNNQQRIISGGDLKITSQADLINANLISAVGNGDLSANNMTNQGEIRTQSGRLQLEAKENIDNSGLLVSGQDLSLQAGQNIINQKTLYANGNMLIDAGQQLINQADLGSAGHLEINAREMENHKGALVLAGVNDKFNYQEAKSIKTNISQTLTNRGLFDAATVYLTAATINNIATGTLFGDVIAINTGYLNNLSEAVDKATIAARKSLLIGAGKLDNRNHSLIYSDGDLHMGGTLNAQGQISGRMNELNNHSAKIEALGNLTLRVDQLRNINDNIQLEMREISRKKMTEYQLEGSPIRFSADKVRDYGDGVSTPNGYSERFTRYTFDRVTKETVVTHSEPGQIIAGQHLQLDAQTVRNENSQLIAGAGLLVEADKLENINIQGQREINDIGSARSHWSYKKRNWRGKKKKHYDSKGFTYTPATVQQSFNHDLVRQEVKAVDIQGSIPKAADINVNTQGQNSSYQQPIAQNQITPPSSAEADKMTPAAIESGNTDVKLTQPSTENQSQSGNAGIAMADATLPALTVPGNQLFTLNQQPQQNYLIETNPRFTQHRQWLGSDYMLQRLSQDPGKTIKRIGDGYYEQQQVRQQLIANVGQRYLAGYSDDSEQYKALLNNGIEYVKDFKLKLGVALNKPQMQQLTKPMVLLVERTLTLPNGQQVNGLYPQLYLPAGQVHISGSGGLMAGREVYAKVKEDLINQGNIQGAEKVGLIAANIIQRNGTTVGGQISMQAEKDIELIGAEIYAKNGLQLGAKGDIRLASETASNQNFMSSHELISRETVLSNQQGDLRLKGQNIELKGASLINQDKKGTLALEGDRVELSGVQTYIKQDIIFDQDNYIKQKESEQVGSKLLSQGNVLITSTGDTLIKGSEINAGKTLAVQAKGNLDIEAGEKTLDFEQKSKITNKGMFSRKTTITQHNINEQRAISSQLNGENIVLNAGGSVKAEAGQIISNKDLAITADRNVEITSVQEQMDEVKVSKTTKSGLMKGGNFGISFGTVSENRKNIDESQLHKGSVVGSLEGNVNIAAGDKVTVHASDVIAKEGLTLTGSNVSLTAGDNVHKEKEHYVRQQAGFTLGIGGTVAELYNAAQSIREGTRESDSRVAALKGVKGVLEAIQAIQSVELANEQAKKGASISINISVGGQKTERESHGEYHSVAGSSLSAQKDVNIIARERSILVQGSEIQGGGTTHLKAAQDIDVIGAVNTRHNDSKTTTMGGQVGIGIGIGSKDSGFRFKGSANFSQERENMNGSAWTESVIEGRNKLLVEAGHDTRVIGGELKGNRVELQTGNNLTMRSLQDTDDYNYKKISGSIEGSYGTGADFNLSLSKTDIKSNYASVKEQSGIKAGEGGFDVKVENKTQLSGAVIASGAKAENNRLETGTLEFADIQNKANYKVSHMSVSIGTGMVAPPMVYNKSGHADSVTKSAVEAGEIVIRDSEAQKQDINGLSRNTENANNPLGQIFDKEKELKRLEAVELVREIAQKSMQVVENHERLEKQREIEREGGIKPSDIKDLAEKLKDNKETKNLTDQQRYDLAHGQLLGQAIDKRIRESSHSNSKMGSSTHKAVTAAASIIEGLLTGNIAGGLAGVAAPHLAGEIKTATTTRNSQGELVQDKETALVLHAILGGVLGQVSGGSALAGAAGAVVGEKSAEVIQNVLYPGKKTEDLSEKDKQRIRDLASIAGGLAGAVAGSGDTQAIQSGLETAKNAVENNYLGAHEDKEKKDAQAQLELINKGMLEASDEKKQQLENTVAGLEVLDKQRDEVLKNACQSLSSAECGAARKELDAAYQSYFATLSPEDRIAYNDAYASYSKYYDGYKHIESLTYGLDVARVEADREILAQRISDNLKVDKATADKIVLGMRIGHDLAGVAAGVVGPKVVKNMDKGSQVKPAPRTERKQPTISPENQKYVDILSPEAKQHILYGESPTQGGHLYPGNPGKTVFPKEWAADKVIHEIGDIATSPNTQWYAQTGTGGLYTKAGEPARWAAYEVRDGVRIRVIYEPANGKIITAFPDSNPVPKNYKTVK